MCHGVLIDRADELLRAPEGRVRVVDDHLREQRGDGAAALEAVHELLIEQVADHPFGLGAEDVERVRLGRGVGLALEGEQPDLRSVAVGDDDVVLGRELDDRLDGGGDVRALDLHVRGFSAAEQRVASEGDDDEHDFRPPNLR